MNNYYIIFSDKQKEENKKPESPKPTAPLTMEIDPHLRHLQEQAKLFSRFNSTGTEPEAEEKKEKEKEPREFHFYSWLASALDFVRMVFGYESTKGRPSRRLLAYYLP